MKVAESYVEAFGKLAKSTNTVIIPGNTSDVSSMVTQVNFMYDNLIICPLEHNWHIMSVMHASGCVTLSLHKKKTIFSSEH